MTKSSVRICKLKQCYINHLLRTCHTILLAFFLLLFVKWILMTYFNVNSKVYFKLLDSNHISHITQRYRRNKIPLSLCFSCTFTLSKFVVIFTQFNSLHNVYYRINGELYTRHVNVISHVLNTTKLSNNYDWHIGIID